MRPDNPSTAESTPKTPPTSPGAGRDTLSHFLVSLATVYGVLIADQGLGILRLLLFAGLLGREGFGAFALATSLVNLVLPLATLSIPSAHLRYVPEYERRGSLRAFFRRGAALLALATVPLVCVGLGAARRLSMMVFGSEEFAALIRLAAVGLGLASVYEFGLAALRGLRQFRSTALLELLNTAIFVGLGIAALVGVARRPEWAMGANLAASGIVALAFAAMLIRQRKGWPAVGDIEPPGPFAARLLGFSGAYIGNAFLSGAFAFLSQWMVNAFVSLQDTGSFGFAMRISQMLLVLISAFNLVLAPYLSGMWIDGEREKSGQLLHLVSKLTLFALVEGALVLQVAAEVILPRLLPEYAGGLGVLRILIAAQLCNASVWTFGQYANLVERPNLKLLASGLGLGCFSVAAVYFAPSAGVAGVAWSLLGAHAAVLGMTLYFTLRIGLKPDRSILLALAAPCALAAPGRLGAAAVAVALVAVAWFTPLLFAPQEKAIVAQTFRGYRETGR